MKREFMNYDGNAIVQFANMTRNTKNRIKTPITDIGTCLRNI